MLRIVRKTMTFLLLGALLTAASAWAIHGLNFWRARAAVPRLVNPASNQSYINLPGWWSNDPDFAEQVGVDTDEKVDPLAVRRGFAKIGVIAITGSYVKPISLIDPDIAWRRHRRVEAGMPPTPDTYFPLPIGYFTKDRLGWAPGESFALVVHHDSTREQRLQMSSESIAVFSIGWPWRSAQVGVHHITDMPQRTTTPAASLAGGITLWTNNGQGPLDRFALPLFPLWPGFALNTLVFAAGIAVLWHVPAGARRMGRRRSGRCLTCGYTVEGLTICPECGRQAISAPT